MSVLPDWGAPDPQAPKSDWTFQLPNLNGSYLFRTTGLPDEWMLKAVVLRGRNITDTPLTIVSGEKDLDGLHVVLSRKGARIDGDVVTRDGIPAPDLTVIVFADDRARWGIASRYVRAVRPDRKGRFSVVGLPAGTYRVAARDEIIDGQWEDPEFLQALLEESTSRSGYIEMRHGQQRAGAKGISVDVPSGENIDRIDVALPRGAVLAGTVLDEAGEPFPGVSVDALSIRYESGRRAPSPVGGGTTDDLGRFRIAGLAPGNYYVVASSAETWHGEKEQAYGYVSSVYPRGPMESAQRITLKASEVREGRSILLEASRAVRVAGRVVRETGEPGQRGHVLDQGLARRHLLRGCSRVPRRRSVAGG